MALFEIPTGILPEEIVETLPEVGEENKVYRRLVEDEVLREMQITDDFIWYDGEWLPFSFDASIYGAYFKIYQESVNQTVNEMQAIIDEQAQKITELEEAVFPAHLTSWEMSLTSLIDTTLDLYNENDEEVEIGAMIVSMCEAEPTTFMAEVKEGTYYLKNSDGYALGKPNGDIQPLVADGTDVIQIGSVEIVQVQKGGVK